MLGAYKAQASDLRHTSQTQEDCLYRYQKVVGMTHQPTDLLPPAGTVPASESQNAPVGHPRLKFANAKLIN